MRRPCRSTGRSALRASTTPDVATPSPTQVKILVPGNHLMVGLLGQRDELLRLIEAAFPVAILVRGNEITVTGDAADAERVGRLFEELVRAARAGPRARPRRPRPAIEMMKADQRPTEVLTTEVVRGRKTIRPKTAGQKRYVDAVRDHTVTFAIGPAGTGKSYLAVALAVQALQAKEVNRIILTRPAVEAGERLGFLPGDMLAKVDPYLRPLYDALYDMLEPEVVARLMERGTIEVAPLAYMRGRTLNDSFIILDEAQNTTPEQMKMFLTRLGFGSKIVVTGDVTQIDLPDGRGRSGPARWCATCSTASTASCSSSSAPATSCGTASCRTSSTRTNAIDVTTRGDAMSDVRCSAPTSSTTSRSTCCAGSGSPQLVLAEERVASARRRDVAAVRRPSRRSPSSTSGSSAATARPTCSRSRSTTSCRRRPPARPGRARSRRARASRAIRRRCSATSSSARRSRRRQAPSTARTLDDELALLVVHGVLHLLDYDHAEPSETRGDAAARAGAAGAVPRPRRSGGRAADRTLRRGHRPNRTGRRAGERQRLDHASRSSWSCSSSRSSSPLSETAFTRMSRIRRADPRRGGRQARAAGWRSCSSIPSRRSTRCCSSCSSAR